MNLKTDVPTGASDGRAIRVSTVELPTLLTRHTNRKWETCIFLPNGDSDVVDTYSSEVSAIAGHNGWVANIKTKITLLGDTNFTTDLLQSQR